MVKTDNNFYPAPSDGAWIYQLAALFLAEIIRSRQTTLRRAAEISARVVNILPEIKSEEQILTMLSEIEKDFQEIFVLKQALHFGYNDSDISVYAKEIKEFASQVFLSDMAVSAGFLQAAARPGATIQQLCLKYPEFCRFLLQTPEKSQLLRKFEFA